MSSAVPVQVPSSKASATHVLSPVLTDRLRSLRDALAVGLVERDVAVRLAFLGALAGEHLLLLGPPGTAKSTVARRLRHAFVDADCFERLMTRFTVPEELFGPLSITALEQDRYERKTQSYLPSASIAFLDEIFKANSAILNALLTLLNEREFDNGGTRVPTPLISVIGASNELPEGEELVALQDRFLLRLHVGPVTKCNFMSLLASRDVSEPAIPPELKLTRAELIALQAAVRKVAVPESVIRLLDELREWCASQQIQVSDRRWCKVVKLLQAAALTNGRYTVSVWDAWLLQHCLWSEPKQRAPIADWYEKRVGTSAAMDPTRLRKLVVAREAMLERDRSSRTQMHDAEGQPLYVSLAGGKPVRETTQQAPVMRAGQPVYLAPAIARGSNGGAIQDRTNGGKGYSLKELEALSLCHNHHYSTFSFVNWGERESYLSDKHNRLVGPSELAPYLEPTRHKSIYVEKSLAEVDELRCKVVAYRAELEGHLRALDAEIRNHLWVSAEFADPAAASLKGSAAEVDQLLARIDKVRTGFAALPRELESAAEDVGGDGDSEGS